MKSSLHSAQTGWAKSGARVTHGSSAMSPSPAEFAKDADRLRRFEQEARATSALNHPNILTVYDTGTHETRPYIVAELLVGEELRGDEAGGHRPTQGGGLCATDSRGVGRRRARQRDRSS